MFNFSSRFTLIDTNWFDQKGGFYFKHEGREKLLALYLNLKKFVRYDQIDFASNMTYMTTVKHLYKETNRYQRLVLMSDVYKLLGQLEKIGVIKVISHNNIRRQDKETLSVNEMLTIKDLCHNNSDYYIGTPLDVIQYMLEEGLTYKHVALFLMMMKWTNNEEKKCYVSTNKLAKWMGYGNKSILKYYADMNKIGVMASVMKRDENRFKHYEHFLLMDMRDKDEFYNAYKSTIDKFRRRDKNK